MVVTPPEQAESRSARHKRMVAEMSNMRTLKWVGVAFLIHLVLIVVTSMHTILGFIRHKNAEVAEETKPTPAVVAPAATPEKPATPAAPTADKTAAAPATPTPAGLSEDDKKLAELKNSNNPEAKKLTATAKPGELPKTPSLKGIDDNP